MDYRYCPKCGKEIEEGNKFCPECGMDFEGKKSKKTLIAVIAVCAVIIICAVAAIVINQSNKAPETTTAPQASVQTAPPSTTEAVTQVKLVEIADPKVKEYNVFEEEGGGFAGYVVSFDNVPGAEGYEIECNFGEGYVDEGKLKAEGDKMTFFFITQEGPYTIRMRAYREKEDGEKEYADWKVVIDMDYLDFEKAELISYTDWEKTVKDYTELQL